MQGSPTVALSNRQLRSAIPQAIGMVQAQRQVLLDFHEFNIATARRLKVLEDKIAALEAQLEARA